ncbi:MAG: DUF6209 family protein [Sandaracinus sp.]
MARSSSLALVLTTLALGSTPFGAGCVGEPGDGAVAEPFGLEGREATLRFDADWTSRVEGSLVEGGIAHLAYDASRASCTTSRGGAPLWSVTAYYRIAGGEVHTLHAAGHAPAPSLVGLPIELTQPGELELWFENVDATGCHAWDSAFGANYRFTVAPYARPEGEDPRAPGWMGNAASVINRATCDGGPCDANRVPLERGFTLDSYGRQRAAIRAIYFDVWREGVTDWDNPELWRDLDVQVHFRAREGAPFRTSYVSFFRRVEHDARYELPMSVIDPLAGPYAVTDASACPDATLTEAGVPGSPTVRATVEYYVTVNGVPLRAPDGSLFRGTFENDRGLYALCL